VLRDWQTFTSADGVAFNDLMNEAELGTAPGATPGARRGALGHAGAAPADRGPGLAEMVQRRADVMVAELLERGSFDLVTDLAMRYVTEVVGELIGLSGERLARFGPPARCSSTWPARPATSSTTPSHRPRAPAGDR